MIDKVVTQKELNSVLDSVKGVVTFQLKAPEYPELEYQFTTNDIRYYLRRANAC